MMQANAAEVKNVIETLTMLRVDVMSNKSKASGEIEEAKSKLQAILDEEENRYVATYASEEDLVAIEDAKLNELFEAIAFLGEKMTHPKQMEKSIDNVVMKLRSCITD